MQKSNFTYGYYDNTIQLFHSFFFSTEYDLIFT